MLYIGEKKRSNKVDKALKGKPLLRYTFLCLWTTQKADARSTFILTKKPQPNRMTSLFLLSICIYKPH